MNLNKLSIKFQMNQLTRNIDDKFGQEMFFCHRPSYQFL